MTEQIYNLKLTEKQAKLLSYACDRLARIIQGQDWTYQEFMEEAWEKRCKEATGESMHKYWDGGWSDMRKEAEEICKKIKKRFWGCEANVMYGIHYDDTADILWDIHQCIRHQLWLDGDRKYHGVDSDTPMQVGSEPLASISKNTEYIRKDIHDKAMELIDKAAVVAEITRRRDFIFKRNPSLINSEYCIEEDNAILNFLDTLQEQSLPSNEAAEKIRQQTIEEACEWLNREFAYNGSMLSLDSNFITDFRKHMEE